MTGLGETSKIEIMSPVGSFEAIDAAIQSGADSVYFGAGRLNMRAAMNVSFVPEDLARIAEICRNQGVKTYLTLNTTLYDEDVDEMRSLVERAREAGISAIIACDFAVIRTCREVGIPVHISTQSNVANIEAVEFYSQFADTVVLGRELSLEKIAEIVSQIHEKQIRGPSGNLVRVEIFVHGYFCMAVSGKCYLSLDFYNSSANRGECRVPCQRKYLVTDPENGNELLVDNEYILSARDLCTIDFIDKILESGVSVLKIEGRKKGIDYVRTVTRCYREAVDACRNGTYSKERAIAWKEELSTVINRGFWSGYYLGKKVDEEPWNIDPTNKIVKDKTYVARCIGADSSEAVEFKLEDHELKEGDDVLIVGPVAGLVQTKVADLQVDGESVDKVSPGEVFSISTEEKVGVSDKIYVVRYEKYNPVIAWTGKVIRGLFGYKVYAGVRKLIFGDKAP